ncbi:D-alanine-D-alanine ligase [Croceitalea dokdonensis DOKDO 023]|uniref:D-alanine--D-alanine ligase n=1 Tax=Croceitalea dokdonensis DOKDO 023 TaxID=1300341 RepID=A0A0P7AVC7_9FLAO|nr:D-alanine--D-alanine ligase [Croceitalea dokdonensis]KPM31833.1 D-alanine-D-alanine ligase [Croceitalea dokdonensis DOKDO 023]
MKKNIAVIMGGFSSEYEISLKSAAVVMDKLDQNKYHCYGIYIQQDGWFYLDKNGAKHPINKDDFSCTIDDVKVNFHCVFNAIHGTPGEDGLLQAYFELLKVPHTSCGSYQAALTFNKRDFLSSLKPYGILCAKSYHLNQGETIDEDAIIKKVGLPCFVKANRAGSSFGISKVYKKEALNEAIALAFKEDDEIIIEQFLDGTEVSVGVITYQGKVTVLPITEIVSDNDFFDYEAKYQGKSQEITPARISNAQKEKVTHLAKKIYQLVKMKGFSRSEFIFLGDEPYLLEMNTTPGLTEESLLPQQAMAAGISLDALFDSAIEEALKNNPYI